MKKLSLLIIFLLFMATGKLFAEHPCLSILSKAAQELTELQNENWITVVKRSQNGGTMITVKMRHYSKMDGVELSKMVSTTEHFLQHTEKALNSCVRFEDSVNSHTWREASTYKAIKESIEENIHLYRKELRTHRTHPCEALVSEITETVDSLKNQNQISTNRTSREGNSYVETTLKHFNKMNDLELQMFIQTAESLIANISRAKKDCSSFEQDDSIKSWKSAPYYVAIQGALERMLPYYQEDKNNRQKQKDVCTNCSVASDIYGGMYDDY